MNSRVRFGLAFLLVVVMSLIEVGAYMITLFIIFIPNEFLRVLVNALIVWTIAVVGYVNIAPLLQPQIKKAESPPIEAYMGK